MKKAWYSIIVIIAFISGYWLHKPKTVIREEIKEVRVYDFTQEPETMEAYAIASGKVLIDKRDFEVTKERLKQEYISGFRDGFKRGKE